MTLSFSEINLSVFSIIWYSSQATSAWDKSLFVVNKLLYLLLKVSQAKKKKIWQ